MMIATGAPAHMRGLPFGLGISELAIAYFVFATIAFDDGSPAGVAAKVLLAGVFALGVLSGERIKINAFLVASGVFLVIAALSTTWSESPDTSSARAVTLTLQFICCFAIVNLIYWKPSRLEFAFSWFIFSSLGTGLFVIVIQGVRFQDNRYADGSISSGQLALVCAFGIMLCIYRFLKGRRFFYVPAALALAMFLVFTSGRRGFLLVIVFIAVLLLITAKSLGKRVASIGIAAIIVVFVYWLVVSNDVFYQYLGQRIQSFMNFVTDDGSAPDASTQGRSWLIDYGYSLYLASPWFGHGIDSFTPQFNALHGSWHTSADNNYVELLTDLGILGLLAYYIPMAAFLAKGIRGISAKSLPVRFAFAAICSMCAIDFANVWFFSKVGILMMALCYLTVHLDRMGAFEHIDNVSGSPDLDHAASGAPARSPIPASRRPTPRRR
ncbi:MAG: O-antigen ligase family protein [Actinobacteria bacterium]|nr:O-antigen ligase family protein [Actinomycetota bacterium]